VNNTRTAREQHAVNERRLQRFRNRWFDTSAWLRRSRERDGSHEEQVQADSDNERNNPLGCIEEYIFLSAED